MRVTITDDPYKYLNEGKDWVNRGKWPCKWVSCKDACEPPFVTAYRKRFSLDKDVTLRAHVSADERYELFLDGKRIGRGSERGDRHNWYYETYDISIPKGDHVLAAKVWSLGKDAPYAQVSVYPGFIFSPEGEYIDLLGTGVVEWEAKVLRGYELTRFPSVMPTGADLTVIGSEFDWGFENGGGDGWQPVIQRDLGVNGFIANEYGWTHLMKPAMLPPMLEDEKCVGTIRFAAEVATQDDTTSIAVRESENIVDTLGIRNMLKDGRSMEIPPYTMARAIVDLENYYCAYPELTVSRGNGSTVRVHWAESLYEIAGHRGVKGNRGEIDGKYFLGFGDTFLPDGGVHRKFDTLWWQAGRYVEILVKTEAEPLTIESFRIRETHYPMDMESKFESSDKRLEEIIPIGVRGLQMCSHETYMDCPYYEQLQYVGDTRLQALTTYTITHDDKLPRKAIRMFDASRLISGLTQSRYPSRVTQVIPPFSLWWVGMVYDYAMWRGDMEFVKSNMIGVRGVLDYMLSCRNKYGLIEAPNGWNFMDWVHAWGWGNPPDSDLGVSGVVNWQMVLVLTMGAKLEEMIGEYGLSATMQTTARSLAIQTQSAFFDEEHSLFADDLAKTKFSEHSQCLALLSDQLSKPVRDTIANSLLSDPNIERTTVYFTYYLFETYRMLGRMDKFFERMSLWFNLKELDFKTTVEMPEPSRSDCHAWGAHPIYHYFASVLGIRPASPGFKTIRIEPQLGPLTQAKGTLVHPRGAIEVDLHMENTVPKGTITLPDEVTGTYHYGRATIDLVPGKQEI